MAEVNEYVQRLAEWLKTWIPYELKTDHDAAIVAFEALKTSGALSRIEELKADLKFEVENLKGWMEQDKANFERAEKLRKMLMEVTKLDPALVAKVHNDPEGLLKSIFEDGAARLPSPTVKGGRMNNIDGKYGEITTSKKQLHPGEPVFLLRAQDPLAPEAIRFYADICKQVGCHPAHVEAARRHAQRIKDWQTANPELVKEKPGPTEQEVSQSPTVG